MRKWLCRILMAYISNKTVFYIASRSSSSLSYHYVMRNRKERGWSRKCGRIDADILIEDIKCFTWVKFAPFGVQNIWFAKLLICIWLNSAYTIASFTLLFRIWIWERSIYSHMWLKIWLIIISLHGLRYKAGINSSRVVYNVVV